MVTTGGIIHSRDAHPETTALGNDGNLPLAIVGVIVFALLSGYHIFICVKQKTWCFWLMLLGALMETAGFGLRAYTTSHPEETRKILVSYLLLILAPAIIGWALFKTFSRTMWYVTPHFKRTFRTTWVPSGIMLKPFKLAYFASFILAWIGAGTIIGSYAKATSSQPTVPDAYILGEKLLQSSFTLQLVCFTLFLIVGLHTQFTARRNFMPSTLLSETTPPKPWTRLIFTINVSTVLLILRTIYHIFEFNPSTPAIKKFLQTHEFTFWAFDAAFIFAILAHFTSVHPGHCLPPPYTVFWFSARKLRKLEKKVQESQTWTTASSSFAGADVEQQHGQKSAATVEVNAVFQPQTQSRPAVPGLQWPTRAHLPSHN